MFNSLFNFVVNAQENCYISFFFEFVYWGKVHSEKFFRIESNKRNMCSFIQLFCFEEINCVFEM